MSTVTLVVMGVSGSGKTTVARQVAERLGWPFAEGDDFHPAANVEKMRAGQPLTDDDRAPWLAALAHWIGAREAAAQSSVLTCSALRREYRDGLCRDHPSVRFAHLAASPDILRSRLEHRREHYMPVSLLESQLALLEPLQPDEPGATMPANGAAADVIALLLALVQREGAV